MMGWQRITADAQVGRGPLKLHNVLLTCDGVGNADITLYEGANTGGRRLFTLKALQHQSNTFPLPGGLLLQDGLFVDVGTNVLEAFIVYEPLEG